MEDCGPWFHLPCGRTIQYCFTLRPAVPSHKYIFGGEAPAFDPGLRAQPLSKRTPDPVASFMLGFSFSQDASFSCHASPFLLHSVSFSPIFFFSSSSSSLTPLSCNSPSLSFARSCLFSSVRTALSLCRPSIEQVTPTWMPEKSSRRVDVAIGTLVVFDARLGATLHSEVENGFGYGRCRRESLTGHRGGSRDEARMAQPSAGCQKLDSLLKKELTRCWLLFGRRAGEHISACDFLCL